MAANKRDLGRRVHLCGKSLCTQSEEISSGSKFNTNSEDFLNEGAPHKYSYYFKARDFGGVSALCRPTVGCNFE